MTERNNNNLDNLPAATLTGDALNEALKAELLPDYNEIIRNKALKMYIKQLEYMKKYREKNKESLNESVKEYYKHNDEYKKKLNDNQKDKYFIKKYGMPRAEYLQNKINKELELIEQFKEENKSRPICLNTYINKINKREQLLNGNLIPCN